MVALSEVDYFNKHLRTHDYVTWLQVQVNNLSVPQCPDGLDNSKHDVDLVGEGKGESVRSEELREGRVV